MLFGRVSVDQASRCLLYDAQSALTITGGAVKLSFYTLLVLRLFEAQISGKKYLKIHFYLAVNTSRLHYKGHSVEVV